MALKLKCRCGETLSAPESAIGKRGKCAKCGMSFIIPGPKAPAAQTAAPTADAGGGGLDSASLGDDLPDLSSDLPDLSDDFGDLLDDALNEPVAPSPSAIDESNPFASPQTVAKPSANRGSGTRAKMGTLANGIKLVFWGTVMSVLGVFSMPFSLFLVVVLGPTIAAMLIVAGVWAVLAGTILATVGRIMCLRVPERIGARWLIFAAVACDLVVIAISIADQVTELPEAVGGISAILSLATLILFVLFVKAVATFVGQPHLAEDANAVIIATVVAILSIVGMAVAVVTAPLLVFVCILVLLGSMLFGLFKYLNLLQHVAEYVRP